MLEEIANNDELKIRFEELQKAQYENLCAYISGKGKPFPVKVCGLTYNDGCGGAIDGLANVEDHSSETWRIWNVDADSFYPTILRNMYHKGKHKFDDVVVAGIKEDGSAGTMEDFCDVLEERLKAKKSGDKDRSTVLKGRINVFTGKLRDRGSNVSDKERVIALEMCMNGRRILAEFALACESLGFKAYHLTTDALMFGFNAEVTPEEQVKELIDRWAQSNDISVSMEEVADLWQVHVNRYYAEFTDGKKVVVGYGGGQRVIEGVKCYYRMDVRTGKPAADAVFTAEDKAAREIIEDVKTKQKAKAPTVITVDAVENVEKGQTSVNNSPEHSGSKAYDYAKLLSRMRALPEDGVPWYKLPNVDINGLRFTTIKNKRVIEANRAAVAKGGKGEKKWAQSTKEGNLLTWDEAKTAENIGCWFRAPIIMVDIDDDVEATVVYNYIVDKGFKCIVDRTQRGVHIFFRMPIGFDYIGEGYKNGGTSVLGCLHHVEYGCNDGKIATIKLGDKDRQVIYGSQYGLEELDELPLILQRPRDDKKALVNNVGWELLGLLDGHGREDLCHGYGCWLYAQARVFTTAELTEVFHFIAYYLLADPYGQLKIDKFGNEEHYKNSDLQVRAVENPFYIKGKLQVRKVVSAMMEKYYYIPVDKKAYPLVYKDGYYQRGDHWIPLQIEELVPDATIANIEEIRGKLHIAALKMVAAKEGEPKCANKIPEEDYVINVVNGRLEILTGKLSPHTPEKLDRQRVPTIYNPDIKEHEYVDLMMRNVTDGDRELETMLWEALGCCLSRRTRRQKAYYFLGEGKNGKSTVTKFFEAVIGKDNIANQSPASLEGSNFSSSQLEGKLANICSELDGKDIDSTKTFKQATGGDTITVERKFENQYTIVSYATFIFATNNMPNFKDKSLAMKDRMLIVPFKAEFSTDDEEYIPDLDEKVTTEEAKSYGLNKAIAAYQALVERNFDYTVAAASIAAGNQYQEESNIVIGWILHEDHGTHWFDAGA